MKGKNGKPWTCFVNDSSVTVGLNSVLKLYLKRRLDYDAGNAVSYTALYVCMFVYFGDLECQIYDYSELILTFSYRSVTIKI